MQTFHWLPHYFIVIIQEWILWYHRGNIHHNRNHAIADARESVQRKTLCNASSSSGFLHSSHCIWNSLKLCSTFVYYILKQSFFFSFANLLGLFWPWLLAGCCCCVAKWLAWRIELPSLLPSWISRLLALFSIQLFSEKQMIPKYPHCNKYESSRAQFLY